MVNFVIYHSLEVIVLKNNFKDPKWINRKFDKLTVLSVDSSTKNGTHWICECDCGNIVSVRASKIISNHAKSCGCLFLERRHGLSINDDGKINRLYSVWTTMRSRCNNPNDSSYIDYGGRGIRVCKEWDSYKNFHDWAISEGYDETAPRGECTLDRINNNGDYSPDNCRWVNSKTQAMNKRPRKHPKTHATDENLRKLIDIAQMKLDGNTYREIGEKYGISKQAVHQYLSYNIENMHNM
jgi:hypothetical protein